MAYEPEEEEIQDANLPPTRPVREPKLRQPPFWLVSALLILLVASWLPLVFFAKARAETSDEPRVQFMQDMAKQPKFKEQSSDEVYADGRADRMPVDGTVAYLNRRPGDPKLDDRFLLGYSWEVGEDGKRTPKFFDTFPDQIKLDDAFIHRGQQRFNIYCSPCHGLDGSGNGLVNIRAHELKESLWTTPADLHSATVRGRPVGHIYNTINVGIRNMPPYGPQIPAIDRWAIVAYVRALQLSQNAAPSMLPAEQLQGLK